MQSYLSHLECSQCSRVYDATALQSYCHRCNAPLLARYNLETARTELDRDRIAHQRAGLWRWFDLLPVIDPANIISLGEGGTPLIPLKRVGEKFGLKNLSIKEEGLNPTGTFKARGMAVAVSKAYELGAHHLIVPSAGNAGGALAAYAARSGLDCAVYIPADTPPVNIAETGMMGAEVVLVDGLISDAAKLVQKRAEREGWFDLSTFKEPYRVEGKKTIGYELAEQLNWTLPDVIVYPTGGGTGLVGMVNAFMELKELGWLDSNRLPRMVAVQSSGCAPVVKAFEAQADNCQFWEDAATIAPGLRVPKPFADRLIMQAIYRTEGTAIAVSDEDIRFWRNKLAVLEGINASPESAATLAALPPLIQQGWLGTTEKVVVFNTGSGLKYPFL